MSTSDAYSIEPLRVQYEIDFQEMTVKFFVVLNEDSKKYGLKLEYKGLYENNALERTLVSFVNRVHSSFIKRLVEAVGDNYPLEPLSDAELFGISSTILNNHL